MKGLDKLKPLEGMSREKARLDRLTSFPKGPQRFSKLKGEPDFPGGPGLPPDMFVVSGTSASEWPPYWASCIIFGYPSFENHREPPYEGDHGPYWAFQKNVPNMLGHPFNSDFVYKQSRWSRYGVSVRIQTEHFHLFAPDHIHAFDKRQRQGVEAKSTVIDIYDYMYINDKSGSAIMALVKLALAGVEPRVALPSTTLHARRSRQK